MFEINRTDAGGGGDELEEKIVRRRTPRSEGPVVSEPGFGGTSSLCGTEDDAAGSLNAGSLTTIRRVPDPGVAFLGARDGRGWDCG